MKKWEERVQEFEAEGMTRSDAQGAADVEAQKGLIEEEYWTGLLRKKREAERGKH